MSGPAGEKWEIYTVLAESEAFGGPTAAGLLLTWWVRSPCPDGCWPSSWQDPVGRHHRRIWRRGAGAVAGQPGPAASGELHRHCAWLGSADPAFGPVSGAHFNPVVSGADWLLGRKTGSGVSFKTLSGFAIAQTAGAVAGAMLANIMFERRIVEFSTKDRISFGHLVGEVVATAGLVALIFTLVRTGRARLSAPAVGAYIGAAYWFTSSTSFANPAVTVGRMFSDSFAGISPSSAPGFVAAQVIGGPSDSLWSPRALP